MVKKCPNCNHQITELEQKNLPGECPNCGIIFEKFYQNKIKKSHEENKELLNKFNNLKRMESDLKKTLEETIQTKESLVRQYEEKIKKLGKKTSVSFKPLIIPLWILIFLNLAFFSLQIAKTGRVDNVPVTPVFIQGVSKDIPVMVQNRAVPISIVYTAGNLPVVIKAPLAINGAVCANPCR